jgi:hypothetical protein
MGTTNFDTVAATVITGTISEVTSGNGVTIDGALIKDGAVPTRQTVTLADANGAIAAKDGLVVVTKGTAAALTLAAPTAATDDGKVIVVISSTAAAHTITQTTPGFNGGGAASDVATFAAAIGNSIELVAYNGVWLVTNLTGVTLG